MNKDYFLDLRIEKGLTQRQVAKDLHLDPSWISRVERDWTKGNYGTIIALAAYYNINPETCKELVQAKKQQKSLTSK